MKRRPTNERGFTLAELLVVIAIMSVLLGVAVGSYAGLIGSGETESGAYELETVQTAVDAYMAVQKTSNITARSSSAVIASADSDASFNTYLRSLPTAYAYTWSASGNVTQGAKIN